MDVDPCVALLCAVARLWARDAARDDHELWLLARWLDMPADDLRRRLTGKHPPSGDTLPAEL
ncbi:MAG: hypothetical protein WA040_07380 [Anaerolineae bacterium]